MICDSTNERMIDLRFCKKAMKFLPACILCIALLVSSASAVSGRAYSVGTNYGSGDIDTSGSATYAAGSYSLCGYTSTVSIVPTFSSLSGTYSDGTSVLTSDVLFFDGHGNYEHIGFHYLQSGGDYNTGIYWTDDYRSDTVNYAGIKGKVNNSTLITFAACLTASNGDNNITKKAVDYGTAVAVGWSESVRSDPLANWLERYHDRLEAGDSVNEAVTYANSFAYMIGSNVKTAVIYGDGDTVLCEASPRALSADDDYTNAVLHEGLQYVSLNEPIAVDDISELDLIANAISVVNPTFSIDDYYVESHVVSDDLVVIDLMRKIGDFVTNSGYTVNIRDGVVSDIVDNTRTLPQYEVDTIDARAQYASNDQLETIAELASTSSNFANSPCVIPVVVRRCLIFSATVIICTPWNCKLIV